MPGQMGCGEMPVTKGKSPNATGSALAAEPDLYCDSESAGTRLN